MQDSSDLLLTKPEKMTMTIEQEAEWLNSIEADDNQLALVIYTFGGSECLCSLYPTVRDKNSAKKTKP